MQRKGAPRFFNSNRVQENNFMAEEENRNQVVQSPSVQINQYFKNYKCSENENDENDRFR